MRRWNMLVLTLCLLGLCLVWSDQSDAETCQGQTTKLTVTGSETITVSTVAIGFTAANITNAALAIFYVRTAPIAYTVAGDTPSATVGFPGPVGTMQGVCDLAQIKAFKAIRTTGADSSLYVVYYKSP